MTIRHPEHGFAPTSDRDDEFTWKPLRLLTFYRLILAGLLTTIFFAAPQATALGSRDGSLFGVTVLAYLFFSLGAGFAGRWRWPTYPFQVLGAVTVDIVAITLLMHASGSLESGLGVLLAVTVAAGSLLLPGRLAYLFAAVATLAVLAEQVYG
ncbi:MAG: two-component sensor histidine kinase, partial [Gammaproteobacteria bacterium]